jgi:hypothetical protein
MRLNFLIRFLTTSRLTNGVTIVASTNNAAGAADHSRPRALSLSLSPTLSLRKPHNAKLRLRVSLQTLRGPPNPNCGIRVFSIWIKSACNFGYLLEPCIEIWRFFFDFVQIVAVENLKIHLTLALFIF